MPTIRWSLGSVVNEAVEEQPDPYYAGDEGSPTYSDWIPPVYLFQDYSVQVVFYVDPDSDNTGEIFTVTSISVSNDNPDDIFTYQVNSDNFIKTTGPESPFEGDYFQFMKWPVDEDGNVDYANPFYTIDWTMQEARDNEFDSITRWNPPSTDVVQVVHTVAVTATSNFGSVFTGNISLNQNVYFDYPPFTQFVIDLVAEGSI